MEIQIGSVVSEILWYKHTERKTYFYFIIWIVNIFIYVYSDGTSSSAAAANADASVDSCDSAARWQQRPTAHTTTQYSYSGTV